MATAADIERDITLEIDGHAVPLTKFQRGVRAFNDLLQAVSGALHPERRAVRWLVQVSKGSNLIGVMPDQAAPGVANALMAGAALLEERPQRPKAFDEAALNALRDLSRLVGTKKHDDTRVRLWSYKTPLQITPRAAVHVSEILKEAYQDYGSVEGRLQTASERGTLRVIVYEPVWDRAIPCFLDEGMMLKAVAAFGRRVEIYGTIHYRADGAPSSITVDEIVPFPAKEELPNFRSVRGILSEV